MISARTCGRLGNFLFQFAAVYGHARKYDFNWCMPSKSMQERLWPTPKLGNIKYCTPQPGKLIQEHGPQYQELPAEDNLILEGYWQSEKYWHGFHKEIAEVCGFSSHREDYVSVHVRRGDYLRFPNEFPVLPFEYYQKAFSYCKDQGYKRFKIFSDDIKWCRANFQEFSDLSIEYSTQMPFADMMSMYYGAAMIIANSSFSLFPALLRSDNPLVIAPAEHRWFGKNAQHLNSKDRMPERFIKM